MLQNDGSGTSPPADNLKDDGCGLKLATEMTIAIPCGIITLSFIARNYHVSVLSGRAFGLLH